jgi:hypothetical protein
MPISVVQTGAPTQVTTLNNQWDVAFASAVTPGNVVVVIARLGTNNRTMGAPTYTGGGGTFASVVSNNPTQFGGLAMWAKAEAMSDITQYRITIASSLTAVGVAVPIELAGCNSATASASGTSTQSTTTTSPRMLDTGLDIASGGIMIGAISTQTSAQSWGTLTAPGSFDQISAAITGTGQISHYFGRRTTSGTAIQGTAITTTARTIYGIAATWIEAPAGGGPFPHFIRRRMFGGMTFPRGGI